MQLSLNAWRFCICVLLQDSRREQARFLIRIPFEASHDDFDVGLDQQDGVSLF